MKDKKIRKSLITGLSAALLMMSGVFSRASELEDIRKAIKTTGARWEAGETWVSKLSTEERKTVLGLTMAGFDPDVPVLVTAPAELPAAIDWRGHGGKNYVTPVKNQAKCGSCWAFATTAALESHALRTQNIPEGDMDLSEQIMLSCSGAGSCRGGTLTNASRFLQSTGLPGDTYFPYTATDDNCLNAAPGWEKDTVKIVKWSYACRYPDINAMKSALAAYGPLPTAFYVYEDFISYKSGIYSYVTGKYLGGHGVLIVGYNDEDGGYFIVKNSWGPDWGENGYFRIAYSQAENSVAFGTSTLAYMP
ncbi:MAG: C1 family peptidase [bacterium]